MLVNKLTFLFLLDYTYKSSYPTKNDPHPIMGATETTGRTDWDKENSDQKHFCPRDEESRPRRAK